MPNIVTIMIRHEERKRERELRLARERERGEEYGRKEGRKMARRKGVLRVCKMRVERNGWVSGGTRACMQKFWFSAGLLASSFFFFFFSSPRPRSRPTPCRPILSRFFTSSDLNLQFNEPSYQHAYAGRSSRDLARCTRRIMNNNRT